MRKLKELCFDYITRPCRSDDGILCIDCPLFCLPFKIYDKVETNTGIVHVNHSYVKSIVIILIIGKWESVIIVLSMEIVQN